MEFEVILVPMGEPQEEDNSVWQKVMTKLPRKYEVNGITLTPIEDLEVPPCYFCEGEITSSCCGYPIINTDICGCCGEHCDNQCSECEHNPE